MQASWERRVLVWALVWLWSLVAGLAPAVSPPHSYPLSQDAGLLLFKRDGPVRPAYTSSSIQATMQNLSDTMAFHRFCYNDTKIQSAPQSPPTLEVCSSLTLITEVVSASSSISRWALGARAAMLVWGLPDPVSPKERAQMGVCDEYHCLAVTALFTLSHCPPPLRSPWVKTLPTSPHYPTGN